MSRLFIKDWKNTEDAAVRQRYGMVSGITGILCNLLLFALKLTVGLLMGSIAVLSDAFNNLSDMGSTVVSMVGIRLSNRKPDRSHPFGHGRFEYISALIVSFVILLVGFELLKTSFTKVISGGGETAFSWVSVAVLSVSLPVKLFMFGYNRAFGKAIRSSVLAATARDSLNDCLATGAVILAAILEGTTGLKVDGWMGLAVSLLILYGGFSIAKDTIGLLLGKAPDPELVKALEKTILEEKQIVGIHDLIVHDYGPGRVFASVHAEISDEENIVEAHEAIDVAEQRVLKEFGCELTVHLDPISADNEYLNDVRRVILDTICASGISCTIHDLRMTAGESWINIIFDMVVPYEVKPPVRDHLLQQVRDAITRYDERCHVVIQVDHDYIGVNG